MDQKITILLSTYNGGKYLAEQLNSIIVQCYQRWELFIRDDGSTDDTVSIIQQYCKKDSRLKLIEDDLGNIGPKKSFSKLMCDALCADACYFAFCDQDDVWVSNKLEVMLDVLLKQEEKEGLIKPVLVYSDLKCVDQNLKMLVPSFVRKKGLLEKNSLKDLLFQNAVTGCATLFNRQLLEIASPVPEAMTYHDWWLALVCSWAGEVIYYDQPLLLYRRHDGNVTGQSVKNTVIFEQFSAKKYPPPPLFLANIFIQKKTTSLIKGSVFKNAC